MQDNFCCALNNLRLSTSINTVDTRCTLKDEIMFDCSHLLHSVHDRHFSIHNHYFSIYERHFSIPDRHFQLAIANLQFTSGNLVVGYTGRRGIHPTELLMSSRSLARFQTDYSCTVMLLNRWLWLKTLIVLVFMPELFDSISFCILITLNVDNKAMCSWIERFQKCCNVTPRGSVRPLKDRMNAIWMNG